MEPENSPKYQNGAITYVENGLTKTYPILKTGISSL